MTQPFPHLFSPLKLGHKTLKNRLVFGAHTANMAIGGLPGKRHLGYYLERARGGAAMIVVEPVPVHATGVLTRGNFRVADDAVIPGFRAITDACHEHGTVMIHQLYHVGQHGDFDNSFQPSWSPSGLPSYHDSDGSHAVSENEIHELIAGFVDAAVRAKSCGFDGVEVFAAYHALVDQFWTPWSNRRDDRWGGSFANRMRFSCEILSQIRTACGPDFIIGFNISVDETTPVSLQIEQFEEIVAWHDERGLMDYVSVGTASYFNFAHLMPTVFFPDKLGPPFAERLMQVARHARVQAESHIRTAENADYVIASGQAHMTSLVRGQILDYINWFAGQLERLGVEVRYNTPLDGTEATAIGADDIIIATGAQPAATGFQRALPAMAQLPGIDNPGVCSVEDIMARAHRPGKRVIVLDEGGNWRGGGTAWHLAEQGHKITIVTPHAMVAKEMERMAADIPLRARLREHGATFITESAISEWSGTQATIVDLHTGKESRLAADTLVLSTCNVAETALSDELTASATPHHMIGDCTAPRSAIMAIYEGRNLAQKI